MPLFKHMRHVTPGPSGATLYFRNTETNDALELAELDGWHYVFVPDGVTLPVQHADTQWQPVTLTDPLREQIKTASRQCHLIAEQQQQKIRERYTAEDEMYFARIGTGVALGVYQFQTGEQDALLAYGAHVESVRQWGRDERAKLGL